MNELRQIPLFVGMFAAFSMLVGAEDGLSLVPQRKHALLIGYSDYSRQPLFESLPSASNDISALRKRLQGIGFVVDVLNERNAPDRQKLVAETGKWITQSADSDFCLIYYSGHAAQRDFSSFLVPPTGTIRYREDLDGAGVGLDWIMRTLQRTTKGAAVVMLDGCRTGLPPRPDPAQIRVNRIVPFRTSYREREYFVVYATEAGTIAGDHHPDNPKNSLFTWSFVQQLDKGKGKTFEQLLRGTKSAVLEASEGRQSPDAKGLLSHEYILSP